MRRREQSFIVILCHVGVLLQLAGSISSPEHMRLSASFGTSHALRCMQLRGGGLFSPLTVNAAKVKKEDVQERKDEELEKCLECPTCLNLLYQPITLLCGHSFCGTCIKSWLRTLPTDARICPLCRAPAEAYLGELRTSYSLASTIRTLFPDRYASRRRETLDALYFPPKDSSMAPILIRSDALYPGASSLVAVSEDDPLLAAIRAAYSNQTRLLYVGDGLVGLHEDEVDAVNTSRHVHVHDVALELEVVRLHEMHDEGLADGSRHVIASVRAHDRVILTEVKRQGGPGLDTDGSASAWGRGRRIYDDVFEEVNQVYKLADEIRGKLPFVLANVMVSNEPPRDPEALSLFVASAMGALLDFPRALHTRFLKIQSTRQRLEELHELILRMTCSNIQRGTLLLSSNPHTDFAFGGSVVLLYRHDQDGTEGVIINQEIGPLEHLLYPNSSSCQPRASTRSTPSLRFGGPVNLGSGARHTQVLARVVNTSEVMPAKLLDPGSGPNISHLTNEHGVLEVVEGGDVNFYRPRSAAFPALRRWQAQTLSGQEESIAIELDDDADGEDDDDGSSVDGEGSASARTGEGAAESMSEEALQGSEGSMHSLAASGDPGRQSTGRGQGGGQIDISHSFSALSSGVVSEDEGQRADGPGALRHTAPAAAGGEFEAIPDDGSARGGRSASTAVTAGNASDVEGGAIQAGGVEVGGNEQQRSSNRVAEAADTATDVLMHGDDEMQKQGMEIDSGAQGVGTVDAASKELLLHGFAAWCPFQLDREIAAGGWYIVKQLANSSVVFDWPHKEMYERLRPEADLMRFDTDGFLEWANARQIRSPSADADS